MFESPPVAVNLETPRKLTILRAASQWLARQLAPPVCVLCGGPGQWLDEPWGLDLCSHCEASCDRIEPGSQPIDSIFCLFRYQFPVDQLITGLKFGHDLACARVLGILLARAWRHSGRQRPECLVPLPLHSTRHRERGFCQTAEIATHLARRLPDRRGRPLPIRTDLLYRSRATAAQSRLGAAARAANLAGAFAIRPGARLPRHVALLDDVLTTGSTVAAAAGALMAGGVARVEIWCCARAMRDNAGPFQSPSPPWPLPTPSPLLPPAAGGSITS